MKRKTLKALSLFLAALMLLSMVAIVPVSAEDEPIEIPYDLSWFDPDNIPADRTYTLTTAAQLQSLAYLPARYDGLIIKLGNDIVLNEGTKEDFAIKAPTYQWTPINGFSCNFKSTIDGCGHTIYGLYINRPDSRDQGFFGNINGETVVKNLNFKDAYVRAKNYCGVLVGDLDYNYIDCYNMWIDATVISTATDSQPANAGGYIGMTYQLYSNTGKQFVLDNCVFSGSVTATKDYLGAFVGRLVGTKGDNHVHFNNCLNLGIVTTSNNSIGAALGGMDAGCGCTATNFVDAGAVKDASLCSSVVGYNNGGTATYTNCYRINTSSSYSTYTGGSGTTTGTVTAVEPSALLGAGVIAEGWTKLDDGYFAVPSGVAAAAKTIWFNPTAKAAPYIINYGFQLRSLSDIVANNNGLSGFTFKLGADIDLSDAPWRPICDYYYFNTITGNGHCGRFDCVFDGDGHVVSGMYFDRTTKSGSDFLYGNFNGFFGCLESSATIKNLALIDFEISGNQQLGGLVGSIDYCGNDAVVNIENVYVDGNITVLGGRAGMLIGKVWAGKTVNISNCFMAGSISCTGSYTAGVVGETQASTTVNISDCLVTTTINSNDNCHDGVCSHIVSGTVNVDKYAFAGAFNTPATNHLGAICTYGSAASVTNAFYYCANPVCSATGATAVADAELRGDGKIAGWVNMAGVNYAMPAGVAPIYAAVNNIDFQGFQKRGDDYRLVAAIYDITDWDSYGFTVKVTYDGATATKTYDGKTNAYDSFIADETTTWEVDGESNAAYVFLTLEGYPTDKPVTVEVTPFVTKDGVNTNGMVKTFTLNNDL